MEKAFDIKKLAEKLKARGLDLAEEAAKIVVEETLNWVEEGVSLSENKFDDLVKPFIPELKKAALELADKIDGQEG
jgi:hypothetical protein